MEDGRSQIWGGATLGLFAGLILGFVVGSYWTTVLYAVLIGAASGVVSNVFQWIGIVARRNAKRRAPAAETFAPHLLRSAEGVLREHSPAEFETTPNAAGECVEVVRRVEDEEWWRAGYDSVESFHAAHEARHPDIRVYAAVRREIVLPEDPAKWRSGTGETIARQIALHDVHPSG